MFIKKWDDTSIINHILARHGRENLNHHYYCSTYPDIHAAACRIFGSWRNAIEACGIDYSEVKKYREWSAKTVIAEIKKLYKDKKSLNSNHIQNNNRPLYMAALKRFKSWGEAIKAAGINYAKIRLRRSMSKEDIKREIIDFYKKKIDLAYPNMRAKYQYLLANGMKKIGNGSWAMARKKCGIKVNYRLPKHKRKLKPLSAGYHRNEIARKNKLKAR